MSGPSPQKNEAERIIREALPTLAREVEGRPAWEWEVIGDNNFAAWNWAEALEREHGVDRQHALRVAFAELREPALARGGSS